MSSSSSARGARFIPAETARVFAVSYSHASNLETQTEGCVAVTNETTYVSGLPKSGGIFDARMGTTDGAFRCATCGLGKDQCRGHPGFISLNYPCLSPIAIGEIKKWLRAICFQCGALIFSAEELRELFAKARAGSRLDQLKALQVARRVCPVCNTPHPAVKKPDKTRANFTFKEQDDGARSSAEVILMPHTIATILDRVSDETLRALHVNPGAHPRNYIIWNAYIPPPAIRPDTHRSGRQTSNDPLTAGFRVFLRAANDPTLQTIPQVVTTKFVASSDAVARAYMSVLVRGTEHDPHSCAMRLKSKRGRLRACLFGKRVLGTSRSTIDGSPRLNLDQISIPLFAAQTLCINETVQVFNRERLLTFVANGTERYPGCSRVIKRDGSMFKPDAQGLVLEDGDCVVRDLVDGDIVAFNRQPTLALSSITAVRVVIDDSALAIGMSVLICPYFNADFDGDQMNQFNYARPASLNEQQMLTSVSSQLVSSVTGAMSVGQADDSLTGLMKITQQGVVLDKYHCGVVCSTMINAPHLREMFARGRASGRDVVSLALARTPITYRGTSGYYGANQAWTRWLAKRGPHGEDADAESRAVHIVDGKVMSGCLDKSSVGSGGAGIYQTIVHEFGARRTIDVIFDMQQIGTNYIGLHGFTTGIRDFLVSERARDEIRDAIGRTLARARQVAARLDSGSIIPPIDKTVAQFYEEQQIEAQRVSDDFYKPIFESIADRETNGIFEMLAIGKGSLTFLVNMIATVGLILINGERVAQNYSFARTLPYFQRFEEAPEARGYAGASFIRGLSSIACIYNSMMARTDIISRALYTSVTGDQNRGSVKNLESVITNNYRMSAKGNSIVSFVYGGDYYDVRYISNVTYGPALIADAKFESEYRFHAGAQSVFEREFETLREDRAEYRRMYKRLEEMSTRNKMGATIKMPFNITHIIDTLWRAIIHSRIDGLPAREHAGADEHARDGEEARAPAGAPAYAEVARIVAQWCDEAPYLFINEIQRRARGWIPEFTRSAARLLQMYVRSELCSARVRAAIDGLRAETEEELRAAGAVLGDVDPVAFVRGILRAVELNVGRALIDPGTPVGIIASTSFSEPFTQDMLDSYKTSAITGGNAGRAKMSKCREILKAYPVARLANPSLLVILEDAYSAREEGAQEIARRIEMLRFSQLIEASQIFCEKYGEPVHPKYAHESAMFEQFARDNPLLVGAPGDLSPWCIRFELDKSALVQKNIDVAAIAEQLRAKYPGLVLVYTTERAARVVMRAYIHVSALDSFTTRDGTATAGRDPNIGGPRARQDASIRKIRNVLLNTVLRGIEGIVLAFARKLIRTRVNDEGAVVDGGEQWAVLTAGTNLARVANVPGVRANMVRSDAVQEMASVLGIEAARGLIIRAMRELVEKCNVRHYMVYADEMTRTGRVTPIERGGVTAREANNVSLRAGQAAPLQVFSEAAFNTRRDVLTGMSGPMMTGTMPRVGTLYNHFAMDGEVIAKYKKSARDEIADL